MDLQPHAVTGTVPEVLAVAGRVDQLAGCPVDGDALGADGERLAPGSLRLGHEVVDLTLPCCRFGTNTDGPGAVGVVALVDGTEVDLEEVAGPIVRSVGRDAGRRCSARTRRSSRTRAVGAVLVHAALEIARDLLLAASEQSAGRHRDPRALGTRSRRPRGAARARRRPSRRAVPRPPVPGARSSASFAALRIGSARASVTSCSSRASAYRRPPPPAWQAPSRLSGLDDLDVRRRLGGSSRVPTVGGEHRTAVRPDEHRRIAAGQAGEVTDVDEPGDQGDVGATLGDGGRQTSPARGVLRRHGADLIPA